MSSNREQLETWAFRSMTAREVEAIEEAAPNRSIPDGDQGKRGSTTH